MRVKFKSDLMSYEQPALAGSQMYEPHYIC